jgi:PAS domain S-box-containing protein
MRPTLKLSQKALILVAIPLVFQVVFVAVLLNMLNESEKEVRREAHAHAVVGHLNRLHVALMILAGGLVAYYFSHNDTNVRHTFEAEKSIAPELAALDELAKGNPHEASAIASIKVVAAQTMSISEQIRKLGDAGTMPDVIQIAKLKDLVNDLRLKVSSVIEDEAIIEEQSPRLQSKSREMTQHTIIGFMIFNIVLALVLVVYFNRGTTRRLMVLLDNTMRLASGKELNPPLKGSDEIAHLDRTFQRMAAALSEASQKERAATENLRLILDSMPVGLVVLTTDGVIEFVNPTLEKMFLRTSDELQGKSIDMLFGETEDRMDLARIAQMHAGSIDECDAIRADATLFPIEMSVSKFRTFTGNRLLITMLDVTERKEVEQLKRELVAIVSHELKTPLTSIHGFLALLAENVYGQLSEQGNQRVASAQRSVDHLINLVRDLLTVEKLKSGRSELALTKFNVSLAVERAVEAVDEMARENDISFAITPCDIILEADEDKITQVVINLLSNAVKYSPKGETVRIDAHNSKDWMELRVTDLGCGVPKDAQKRIFQSFEQVDSKSDEKMGGTGLGLSICKAIVEQHSGHIGVDSTGESGSTFWIRIPMLRSRAAGKNSASQRQDKVAAKESQ